MSRLKRSTLAASLLVLLAGCLPVDNTSEVRAPTGVFRTASQAAAAGATNRRGSRPLARLAAGDSVTVLGDTYGKDYWACRVRTKEAVVGWVLCTSLNYRDSGA